MKRILLVFLLLFCITATRAQEQAPSVFNMEAGARYWVTPDIVYAVGNNTQLKLDVWYPNAVTTPTPTLVYIHGGGWIWGTKESSVLNFLPFMERGWRIVNVEYRMASNSVAPAAVEDLLLRIDGKPIFATAFGTWAAALSLASLAVEHDAAPRTLVFDANGSSFCNPRIPRRRSHAFASSISTRSTARLPRANATTVADQL